MDVMRIKTGKTTDSTTQLQDAEDLEDEIGNLQLGEIPHSPTPYIVVREFPAWIERGKSAFGDMHPHNYHQSATHNHNRHNGHLPSNGNFGGKSFGDHSDENGSAQFHNAKQLINQLGLIHYKKPGNNGM